MQCDYCNEKKDAFGLLSLPCGYLVCSHHIKSAEDNFKCFVCDEHIINRQLCLEMAGNRKKMEKMSFVEKEKDILNICDQIDQFKLDPKSFLEKFSDDIKNKIDLKREVLKTNFNKLVDNYYESLLNDATEKQLNIFDSIQVDLEEINTKEIREKLNLDSKNNLTDYQLRIKSLVDLRSSYLDEHLINFQSLMNIEFFEGEVEPQVIMPKLFGTIDLKDSNDIFRKNSRPLAYSKSLSNEFEVVAQVGLEKILELSSGEVVFTSQSKKSNLLIFNPQNGKTKEINGHHDIKYLFKTDNDEIIIIDSEYHVKIWYDFKCVNTFDIVRQNFLCVELEKDKIIILSDDHFFTILNCYNGQTLSHIYFEKQSSCYFLKPFSDCFIYCWSELSYRNEFFLDLYNYKPVKTISIKNQNLLSNIVKSNEDGLIIGSETGHISILNGDLSTKVSKKCHKSSTSSIVLCENGLIVSICVDGKIKIWDPKELNLINEAMVKNPVYGRILKSGRLVYTDKDFNLFISL
ncbi:hypothetical protein BpHYR1_022547 [Brachionus plicatilis]|uniref:Uncharacterized protein n=1 Tax=Brachionus plicatilis TaxID=10195 RepID=A0A3M7QDJ1_BRAPC|nr:hypothetical protein BpHYR1_022547 [Brachionus plicatilis]